MLLLLPVLLLAVLMTTLGATMPDGLLLTAGRAIRLGLLEETPPLFVVVVDVLATVALIVARFAGDDTA